MFVSNGQWIRFLAAVVLIAALTPGATVLCLSSAGHVALENQLAPCCTAAPAPSQSGGLIVSGQAGESCADCADVLVLGVKESPVQHNSPSSDQAILAPVKPEVQGKSLGTFEHNPSAHLFPSSNPPSSNPLRC